VCYSWAIPVADGIARRKSLFFATNSMCCAVDRRSGWPSAVSIACICRALSLGSQSTGRADDLARDGHTGSPDFGSIPLAKWTRGAADRIDPAGLPRSRDDLWRVASPSSAQRLSTILQRQPHAPFAEEGRADSAPRPERRARACLANLGRASPSVRSSLNIRQGQAFPSADRRQRRVRAEYADNGTDPPSG
jgi:hypothetical protein